jgi:hypothetical protein
MIGLRRFSIKRLTCYNIQPGFLKTFSTMESGSKNENIQETLKETDSKKVDSKDQNQDIIAKDKQIAEMKVFITFICINHL